MKHKEIFCFVNVLRRNVLSVVHYFVLQLLTHCIIEACYQQHVFPSLISLLKICNFTIDQATTESESTCSTSWTLFALSPITITASFYISLTYNNENNWHLRLHMDCMFKCSCINKLNHTLAYCLKLQSSHHANNGAGGVFMKISSK